MGKKDIYKLPATVLFILGIVDLIRGVMHTFLLTWSAANIAQFDLTTTPEDQIFMLGVFGISNLLTGVIYLIISTRARELSPYILIVIPLIYLIGLIGIWSCKIHANSAFDGQYMMYCYFTVCIITFIVFSVQKYRLK